MRQLVRDIRPHGFSHCYLGGGACCGINIPRHKQARNHPRAMLPPSDNVMHVHMFIKKAQLSYLADTIVVLFTHGYSRKTPLPDHSYLQNIFKSKQNVK